MPTSILTIRGRIGRADWWLLGVAFPVGWMFATTGPVMVIFALLLPVDHPSSVAAFMPTLLFAVYVPAALMHLAATARRIHDHDRSAWWMLLLLIPMLGGLLALLWLGCMPGSPRPNRFGDDPIASSALTPAS